MSMFHCNIMQHVIPLYRALFLSVLLLSSLTARAVVIDTGDVQQSFGVLDIGTTAYGKREISYELVTYTATHLGNSSGVRGELFLDGTQYKNSAEIVIGASGQGLLAIQNQTTIQAGTVVIGDTGSGDGSLSLATACFSQVQLGGNSPVLIVGNYGSGNVSMYSNAPLCSPLSLTVQGATPGGALTYIAKRPGSTGTITLTGAVTFNAGDLMRIGLDESDQPGGMGTLSVNPLYDPTHGLTPAVSAKLTKIGPQGTLNLTSALDTHSYTSVRPSSLTGDVENWGTLGGAASTTIYGNLINHAKLIGLGSGITCGCVSQEGLTVTGNYTQTATGQHQVRIVPGQFGSPAVLGTLTVQSSAHYEGSVNVAFLSGVRYQVSAGQIFTVLSVPSGTATYDPGFVINIDSSALAPDFTAVADVTPAGITVQIVNASGQVAADLALGMTDTPDPVLQGQTVSYTINVTNNGPSPATNVTVGGTLPGCALGSIASGATVTCTRMATATTAGTLTQTMTVSGSEMDPNTANNITSVSTTVNPAADLSIAITDSPDPVLQGQTVSYDIFVTNNGLSTATGVVVSGSLPGCTLGNIPPGATASCVRTATTNVLGVLSQTMTASGDETDPNPANNSASASSMVNPGADLVLSMTDAPDPVKQNAKLTYTLTIVNNGPSSASVVSLTDVLPIGIALQKVTTTQGSCTGTDTVNCALGTLTSGASAKVTITGKTQLPGTISNSATVSSSVGDPNTANNSATATTLISGK